MPYHLLIDGALVDGTDTINVIDPTMAQPFAQSPRASAAQAEAAIQAAKRAQPAWEALGYEGRRPYLERFAEAITANLDSIAGTLTRERGGPIADCRFEVGRARDAIAHFATQSLADRVLLETPGQRIVEQRYAHGVLVAIMPWNRPMTLLSFKLGPALITGNTVIAKPAPTTPLSTLLLGQLAAEIFPAGVFQTLVDANDLGPLLTSHPDVAHVSFTGSTPTGKKVLASAADTLKRFTLELGGNDAAIVLDDADIAKVADRIFAAAFINAGQVCFATKRVYAPRRHAADLAAALAERAAAAVLGDGMDPSTTMGPLQNRMQFDKVLDVIASARAQGGRFLTGGDATGQGYFIRPAIVTGLPEQARLVQEEQFGPVLPVLAYEHVDEAVAAANASDFGLGGTIWGTDTDRAMAVASRIQTGTIWVNQHMALPLDVPFGGAKQSGIGLQNGLPGMEDVTQLRVLNAILAE